MIMIMTADNLSKHCKDVSYSSITDPNLWAIQNKMTPIFRGYSFTFYGLQIFKHYSLQ